MNPVSALLRRTPFGPSLSARRLARGSKRLDACAGQMAHLLHLAQLPSFEGKTCVEIGCGAVMSHALVLHLLGAARVYAVDVVRMARPAALREAVLSATASLVRDILSPFADHEVLRARLEALRACSFTFEGLENLGVTYVAPVDLAKGPLGRPFDLVYSNSVLEHVPPREIPAVLEHLTRDLRPGGAMIHAIHLEDHRDHARRPFDFLALPTENYPDEACYSRGNRVRASTWKKTFASLPGFDTTTLYEWRRAADLLPDRVDPTLPNQGTDDLRASHLAVSGRRK